MLDKYKSFSKSELVVKGTVEFSRSESVIINKKIFFSLEILFNIGKKFEIIGLRWCNSFELS